MSSEFPSFKGSEDICLTTCPKPTVSLGDTSEESTAVLSSQGRLRSSEVSLDDNSIGKETEDRDKEKYCDLSDLSESSEKEKKFDVGSSISRKSPSIRRKEVNEHSPFKEALKGFVLSKLVKKSGNAESSLDGDKKTLFSGIKEKIAKKLEDSSSKEQICVIKDSTFDTPEVCDSTATSTTTVKHSCELKSVVANDHSEPAIVEEAEECFEEAKVAFFTNGVSYDSASLKASSSSPLRIPKSQTISKISTGQQNVKSKLLSGKNLSVSYSDLQKANDLDISTEILQDAGDPLYSDSFKVPDCSTVTSSSFQNVVPQPEVSEYDVCSTESVHLNRKLSFFLEMLKKLSVFFKNLLLKSIFADILVLITAILTYYFFYKHPFVAGLLCGVSFVVLFWLLYMQFVHSLMQSDDLPTPAYKPLPPLNILLPLCQSTNEHEGWMNQLNAEYDPESYQLTNTVSVFVCIREDKLILSYPKKNIPRQSTWNEKKVYNNPFIREDVYTLRGAKIIILPEGLQCKRIWNKRYPLCLILAKRHDLKQEASSDSNLELNIKAGEVSSNSSSQSTSPSSSPLHIPSRNIFYLFSRTDREKEEWYWKFYHAVRLGTENQSLDLPCQDDTSMDSLSEVQKSSKAVPMPKDDDIKSLPDHNAHKPVLNFDHYMALLLKQQLGNVKVGDPQYTPHIQWLNVFFGRLFFDFFVQKKWVDMVMERIQHKLDRIKMPQYMQKLVVTDVYLGTRLPQIQTVSEAVIDEKGLWLDFNIIYEGCFQMTLETKFKSMKRPAVAGDKHQGEDTITELSSEDLSEYWDEEEDLPELEVSKEDSPSHQPTVSTGAKLLHSVEKWVTSSNIAENSLIKRCVQQFIQARMLLTVEISSLQGTLAVNVPPIPTDRLWYGFRTNPKLSLNVFPMVGERHINLLPIVQLIKRKLLGEFQRAVVMPNMDDLLVPIMHSTAYDNL